MSARLGDHERALAAAEELDAMEPLPLAMSFPQDLALGIRAEVAAQQGRVEEALSHLEALRFYRSSGSLFVNHDGNAFFRHLREHFLRAEILERLGRYEEALG